MPILQKLKTNFLFAIAWIRTKSRLHLIPEIKKAWKFASVQISTLLLIVASLDDIDPTLMGYLPDRWVQVFAIVILISRLIYREKKN